MKIHGLILVLVIGLASCAKPSKADTVYSETTTNELIFKSFEPEKLTLTDYQSMLSQLDCMFDIVYQKAKEAIDKGIEKDHIRSHLATDSEYMKIAGQATILDSILLRYLTTPEASHDLRIQYKQVAHQASKRAAKVGLY